MDGGSRTTGTGFGDSNLGLIDFANGSEIDGLFAFVCNADPDGRTAGPHGVGDELADDQFDVVAQR